MTTADLARYRRPPLRLALAAVLLPVATAAWSITVDDTPPFLTSRVDPNVMLMVDNSGSMSNIVPDLPYNPATNHSANCTSSYHAPGGFADPAAPGPTSYDIFIRNNNTVKFGSNGIDGSAYIFGTSGGSGTYRCFNPNAYYNFRLFASNFNSDCDTFANGADCKYPSGYLDTLYRGDYLNWYFGSPPNYTAAATLDYSAGRKTGTQQRMEVARSAAKVLVDSITGMRLGLSTYYNSNQGGTLLQTVDDLSATKRTAIKNAIDGIDPTGQTPLAETLSGIGRYFALGYTGNLTLHPGKANQSVQTAANIFHDLNNKGSVSPVQYSCQKNFAVFLTDGRPQGDRNITSALRDYSGDCAAGLCNAASNTTNLPSNALTTTTYQNGTKIGRSYEQQGSDYLDDVAMALYEMDLRPDLSAAPGSPIDDKNNVTTFMLGFADDQVRNDALIADTATRGGGSFIMADDSADLVQAFEDIAKQIARQTPSSAALSANSTSIQVDGQGVSSTYLYQAKFDSADWTGMLLALRLGADGTISNTPQWDAGALITGNGRRIFSHTGSNGTGQGIPFAYAGMSASQKALLDGTDNCGPERVAYLAGDRSKEGATLNFTCASGTSIPKFRVRPRLLGDIINSDPAYHAGALYVGANDGMLHAFDASTGSELFAYVPSGVYANLARLTESSYNSSADGHRYFVDGAPNVAVTDFGIVLVGGLNAGGKSIYALSVTDPSNFSASNVLWEFSDPDLGLTYSQPQIAKLVNGQWAAIFGNGYNSIGEKGYLYIVNLANGSLIRKIRADTNPGCTGACGNGLSTPILHKTDGDIADYVYAGDLQGQMWRFNLSSACLVSSEGASPDPCVAYHDPVTNLPIPLFRARYGSPLSQQVQPITAQPQIYDMNGGTMVLFGTGQYLSSLDVPNTDVQTFFGIFDGGNAITDTTRGTLRAQEFTHSGTVNGFTVRATAEDTDHTCTDSVCADGWYLDFTTSPTGERITSKALVVPYDPPRVVFTTVIPNAEKCQAGGRSFIMQLLLASGSAPSSAAFNLSGGDTTFDEADNLPVGVTSVVVTAVESTVNITKTPVLVSSTPDISYINFTGTSGETGNLGIAGPGTPPGGGGGGSTPTRVYWMQIQ